MMTVTNDKILIIVLAIVNNFANSSVSKRNNRRSRCLLIQLRAEVLPKGYQFGMAVEVPEHLLLQYSSYAAYERFIKVLDYWLSNHQNLTWRDVAKALHDIDLHELAEGIMDIYKTGTATPSY